MQRTLSVGRGMIYRAIGSSSQLKRNFHQKARHTLPAGLGEIYQVESSSVDKNIQVVKDMIKKCAIENKCFVLCEGTTIGENIADADVRAEVTEETIERLTAGESVRANVVSPGHISVFQGENYISHSRQTARSDKSPASSLNPAPSLDKVIQYDMEKYKESTHKTTTYFVTLDLKKIAELLPDSMNIATAQAELRDMLYDVSAKKENAHNCATAVTGWISGTVDIVDRRGMNPLACLYNLLEQLTPIDNIDEMRVLMRQTGIDRTLSEVSRDEAQIKFGPSSANKASDDLVTSVEETSPDDDTPKLKF